MRKGYIIGIAFFLIFLLGVLPAEAQKGPITVGLLLPVTGPQAANGKDMVNGFQLFLDEQGGKLAGREVKVLIEDDESKPATGLTKLRGMVEGQGVHILIGPLSAAVGYALRDYLEGKKFPAILSYCFGRGHHATEADTVHRSHRMVQRPAVPSLW